MYAYDYFTDSISLNRAAKRDLEVRQRHPSTIGLHRQYQKDPLAKGELVVCDRVGTNPESHHHSGTREKSFNTKDTGSRIGRAGT